MSSPDLSGVLPRATKVVSNNNNNTQQTVTRRPVFTVDRNGSIDVESLKGSNLYTIGKSYDKDGNHKLQLNEIFNFLNNKTISDKDVSTGYNRLVYYQEKDENGNITKRAYYDKKDGKQYVYSYENGKPATCDVLEKNKCSYHYDFGKYTVDMRYPDSDEKHTTVLFPRIRENMISVGQKVYNECAEDGMSLWNKILNWF